MKKSIIFTIWEESEVRGELSAHKNQRRAKMSGRICFLTFRHGFCGFIILLRHGFYIYLVKFRVSKPGKAVETTVNW